MPTATKQGARREAARRPEEAGHTREGMDTHGRRAGSRMSQAASTPPERSKARPIDPKIQETWRAYKTRPRSDLREQLIVYYMSGHVRRIADRMRTRLPDHVDTEDLVQQGYLGLVESIERFELERGIKFETFSRQRISGAMQDYLRSQDHLPRLVRTRYRKISTSIESFRVRHGRTPDLQELQQTLDLDDDTFAQVINDRHAPSVIPFSSVVTGSSQDNDGTAMNNAPDADADVALKNLQRSDLQRWITRGMDRRDRLIILLYYYEEMTMREIGLALGCSESRISQRLDSILRRLRSQLSPEHDQQQFHSA